MVRVRRLVWDRDQNKFVAPSALGYEVYGGRGRRGGKSYDRYIKGPLPYEWFTCAARLRGRALAAALAIHYVAGLHSTLSDISVSNQLVEAFGVNRYAKRRALKQLAAAGLITMTQEGKAAPRVTIVLKRGRLSSAFEAPRPSGPRDVSETAFRSRERSVVLPSSGR